MYGYLGRGRVKTLSAIQAKYIYISKDVIRENINMFEINHFHSIGIDEPVMMDRAGEERK